MSTLYENLSSLCKSKGITGAKMCNDIGVSKSLMTSLKSGRTSSINTATAQKIADYFNIPVDHLLNTETDPAGVSFDNIDVDGVPELQVVTRPTRSVDAFIGDATRQKKEPAPTNGNGQNMYDLKVLTWFHSLPEEKRQAILALGDAPAELRDGMDRGQSSKTIDPPRTK